MPRSLRWTLAGWYGLLLAGVIAVFGTLVYGRFARGLMAGVDATLEHHAQAIAGALDWDPQDGWELDLSGEYQRGVAESGWFEVQDAEGRVIRRAGTALGDFADRSPGFQAAGEVRRLVLSGEQGTLVIVGRSIAAERAALRALLATILAVGAGLLALSLLGGWWLATRSLRPIAGMSHTASHISAHELAQRIDTGALPAELQELGRTLNDAFARLEQAFQRQARFTADASHELRTPLTVIRTQCEQVLRRERGSEEYRSALAACLRSAERMSGITQGLLTLARADAGEADLARDEVALDELVRQASQETRAAFSERAVDLRLDLAPSRVHGDPVLLAEVVANLVSNAIRYNHEHGRVDVRLQRENGSVVLQVADDGPGIPPEALPHVFERFFRVDPARSRASGGSGLGLAITRWIVEAHGGAITVASALERGSTFRVTLPAP
jgi:heavy metal sensor kinase